MKTTDEDDDEISPVTAYALSPDALLVRFRKHVLPDGFVKIRHFGRMAARHD